jgi:hypothetical protein
MEEILLCKSIIILYIIQSMLNYYKTTEQKIEHRTIYRFLIL